MSSMRAFFYSVYSRIMQWVTEATPIKMVSLFEIAFLSIFIYLFFAITGKFIKRVTVKYCSIQMQTVISKALKYAAWVIILMTMFHRLGIDVSALLGAAGIAGIAVGFAAQTSVSNVISGLFVLTERTFKIGDVIEVSGMLGTVYSIHLLSTVLQTFDNQYVRIPNETIIKANLTNYSYFPFRRIKTELSVAIGSDLKKVEQVLLSTARANALVLEMPEPSIFWKSFDSLGIALTLHTWTKNEHFVAARNALFIETAERLAQEGIKISFPQMDIRVKNV